MVRWRPSTGGTGWMADGARGHYLVRRWPGGWAVHRRGKVLTVVLGEDSIGKAKQFVERWDALGYGVRRKSNPIASELSQDDKIDFLAVRFTELGRLTMMPKGIEQAFAQIGLDSDRDFCDAPEEVRDRWIDATQTIDDYGMMPPVSPGYVRVNHNIALHSETTAETWDILEQILREGLRPQPEGRGKYSELPGAVFGVVDDPKQAPKQGRRYNPYGPWVIADLPMRGPEGIGELRPGNVAVLTRVPREYIVGVNGIPVDRFERAYARFGRLRLPNPIPRIPRLSEIPAKTKLLAAGVLIAGIGVGVLFRTAFKRPATASKFGREVLSQAQKDVGVTETDGSGRVERMLLTYGITYPVNWCAVATGTWIHQAASAFGIVPPIAGSPGAKDTMTQFQNALNPKVGWVDAATLRAYPWLVQPGMIVVCNRGPVASYMGHIGVVEQSDGKGNFSSIEGNAGPGAGSVLRNQHPLSSDALLGMGYFVDASVFDPKAPQTGASQVGVSGRLGALPSGTPYEPTDYPVTFDNGAKVETEVVATPKKQARGLMHRQHLDEDRGMLFVYASPNKQALWMRNTLIPLDGIFMDAQGVVVGIVENLRPLDEKPRGVDAPIMYILETNAGWAKRHGVSVGTRARFGSKNVGVGFTQDPPGIKKFEPS